MKTQRKTSTKSSNIIPSILLVLIIAISMIAGAFYNMGLNDTAKFSNKVALFFIILILIGSVFVYLYTMPISKAFVFSKQLICFFVCEAIIISIIFLANQNYLVLPILIAPMIIALVVDVGFAIVINMFFSIYASLIMMNYGFDIIAFYILGGTLGALLIKYTKTRKNIAIVAGVLILLNVVNIILLNIYLHNNFIGMDVFLAFLNSSLSVIITIGILPFIETVFDVMTPSKLLEFSNIDQPLIKRLLSEAPGTFHHSQAVASLAEKAAMDINADHQLARVASLYHDIGKLKRPEYFGENQENGINPHDELAAENSAKIILSHVSDGVALANEYKLPSAIKNILKQHQGDAVLRYFYNKAKNSAVGNEVVDIKNFSYPGPRPQTREAGLVMLADSTEAAVRSIPAEERTLDTIEEMIKNVIKTRFQEGQLNESNLTINELSVIESAFLQVYKGKDHSRNFKK